MFRSNARVERDDESDVFLDLTAELACHDAETGYDAEYEKHQRHTHCRGDLLGENRKP